MHAGLANDQITNYAVTYREMLLGDRQLDQDAMCSTNAK